MKHLVVALVLTACGKGTVPQRAEQGLEFREDVQAFILAGRDRGIDVETATLSIEIHLGTPRFPGAAAECRRDFLQARQIVIGPTWDTMDEHRRRAVLFHELGHCVLNLGHRSGIGAVMSSASVNRIDEHLLDELFAGTP